MKGDGAPFGLVRLRLRGLVKSNFSREFHQSHLRKTNQDTKAEKKKKEKKREKGKAAAKC